MFADDTRIMSTVQEDTNVETLQKDLEHIYKWAEENNMKFNSDKFELLRYD